MAASMGGLDALTFTGGVGEGSARIRHDACEALTFLGVVVDADRNRMGWDGDREVSPPGSTVRVLVVHAREDVEIARVRRLVG